MLLDEIKKREIPISKRMVIIPLLIVTVFTVLGFAFIYWHINRKDEARYEQNLKILAHSGSQAVKFMDQDAGSEDFDRFADAFASNSRLRITIIDATGTVLGDSQVSLEDIPYLENHSERPEIIQAGDSGIGIAQHYSNTLNENFLYVAVPYAGTNHRGYFRVALPLTELEQERAHQRYILGIFCILALFIIAFSSIMASRHLLSLVDRIKHNLEQGIIIRNDQIDIMHNFITQLTACNSMDEILKVIDLTSSILLPGSTGALALIKSSRDKVEIAGTWNGQWPDEPSYLPDQCWALRTGRLHEGDSGSGTLTCEHSPSQNGKMVCIPLIAHGETHGVLHLIKPQGALWTPEEHRFASAIAEHTSLSIANLHLRESLRQQAIRDPLTGLFNRRYLMETIDHEFTRAARHKQKLGILMMDLDHFKRFNDEHGHEIGDFILSEFGRLIKMIIRNEDLPCRYGGEEFMILLPQTDYDGTRQTALKIVSKVRGHNFTLNNKSYGPVTVSIGSALYPDNGGTPEELLKQADDALYEAKRSGRDRVVCTEISKQDSEQHG